MMIEIPRNRGATAGKLILSSLIFLIGAALFWDRTLRLEVGEVVFALVFVAVGGYGIVTSLRDLITGRPSMRATDAGLWFGGRRIRWSEVDAIYVAHFRVRTVVGRRASESVAITFRSKRTWLALPLTRWVATLWSLGDVDVSPQRGTCSSLVAELEAMRALAVGHEDGVIAGTNPIPAARVLRR